MRALMRMISLALLIPFLAAAAAWAEDPYVVDPGEPPSSLEKHDDNFFDPGIGLTTDGSRTSTVDGERSPVRGMRDMNAGFLVPDGRGGYVFAGADNPMAEPRPSQVAARELKLKIRELADQLLNNAPPEVLSGVVAMPVSFVHQDRFQQSSSFGRYMAEQMFYEFNQRGMPIREYRLSSTVSVRSEQGEFLLTRRIGQIPAQRPNAVILIGTYYYDRDNLFVNARLIQAMSGLVLRTGLIVLPQTTVTRKMLAGDEQIEKTHVRMRDFTEATEHTELTPIDLGQDVH